MNRRWIQFKITWLMLLIVVVSLWFALRPHYLAWRAVNEISNSDIQFNPTPFGIFVDIDGENVGAVLDLKNGVNPWLFRALSDKEKFVAAHMLLTKINVEAYLSSMKDYNGYDFSKASKPSKFDPRQMRKLRDYWKKQLNF